MHLTDDKARTMRCCGPDGCGLRPKSSLDSHRRCVASSCMAWRWGDPAEEIEIFRSGETDAGFAKRRDATLAKRRGYCGLSGTPLGVE